MKIATERIPAKPTLLAGGNPRIGKADGDASVQAYVQACLDWKRDVGRRLDAIIVGAFPGMRKAIKWNALVHGGRTTTARTTVQRRRPCLRGGPGAPRLRCCRGRRHGCSTVCWLGPATAAHLTPSKHRKARE